MTTRTMLGCILLLMLSAYIPGYAEQANSSDDSATRSQQAEHYISEGKLKEAAQEYREMLKEEPASAVAYRGLGLVYWTAGVISEAVRYYQEALRLDPDCVSAHIDLGVICSDLGQHLKAIEHYERAAQLDPGSAWMHLSFGNILWRAERYPEAIEQYLEALRLQPDLAAAYIGLGSAYLPLGKMDEALQAYNEAVKLDDQLADAYYNRGIVLTKQGKYEEATADFQHTLSLEPEHASAYFELGSVQQQTRRYEEAIKYYQQAAKLNPDDAVAYHNLAQCYARLQDRDAAEKARQTAKELQDYQDKVAYARAYIDKYPDKGDGYAYLGSLYQKRGHHDQAIRQYQLGIVIDPAFIQTYSNLADLYIQQREFGKAADVYVQALKQQPDDIRTRVMLALLYKEHGHTEHANEQIDIALGFAEARVDAEPIPEHLELLAFVYYAKGWYDTAVLVIEEAMQQDPDNPAYQRQLNAIRKAQQIETK